MGKREGGIPKKGTRARRLLEVIAVSGEFPAKSISRLPGGISCGVIGWEGRPRLHCFLLTLNGFLFI